VNACGHGSVSHAAARHARQASAPLLCAPHRTNPRELAASCPAVAALLAARVRCYGGTYRAPTAALVAASGLASADLLSQLGRLASEREVSFDLSKVRWFRSGLQAGRLARGSMGGRCLRRPGGLLGMCIGERGPGPCSACQPGALMPAVREVERMAKRAHMVRRSAH
jgi:hypothetical protein